VITALLAALVVAFVFQPNRVRLYVAGCFVGLAWAHELFLSELDGIAYYGSAALFDLGVIMATTFIRPIPQIVPRVHVVCIASIIMNSIGWVMWYCYLSPAFYDAAFVAIYLAAVVAILWGDNADVGYGPTDRLRPSVNRNSRAGVSACTKDKGTI
jgi:hypothetical protein